MGRLCACTQVEVIPEVKLLTTSGAVLSKQQPHLMFNTVSYSPGRTRPYTVVFAFLDEGDRALHPKTIHIGHDGAFRMDGRGKCQSGYRSWGGHGSHRIIRAGCTAAACLSTAKGDSRRGCGPTCS